MRGYTNNPERHERDNDLTVSVASPKAPTVQGNGGPALKAKGSPSSIRSLLDVSKTNYFHEFDHGHSSSGSRGHDSSRMA
jgi:hypothetical protein